jgi:broad specificity phosphatase PhoE
VSRLVVVRHSRTAWNAAARFQGQRDPGLDDVGWAQTRGVAEAVAALAPAVVVSSDLRRARQTAHAVARRAGVPLVTDRRLREVALGRLEGLDRTEAARRYPGELDLGLTAGDARPAGGETVVDAGARAAAAIESHVDARPGERLVVVVAHGIVLQAALRHLGVDDAPHLPNGGWVEVAPYDRRSVASIASEAPCSSITSSSP